MAVAKFSIDPPISGKSYSFYKILFHRKPPTVVLMVFIEKQEDVVLGQKANMYLLPMQAGEYVSTNAGLDSIMKDTHFNPRATLTTSIDAWAKCYKICHV